MNQPNAFQLSKGAAETYENQRVPAIFGPMAEATLDAISLPSGGDILDVACGTGVMARSVATRLAKPSRIVGCDLNSAMIDVAKMVEPRSEHKFEWIAASAQSMPLDDASIDMAFCQHGLQFFPDKSAALQEIRRILVPSARLVITCWSAIPPFFQIVAEALRNHLGEDPAATAVKPFIWNDRAVIYRLLAGNGYTVVEEKILPVIRRLPADRETMRNEILATPNEDALRVAGDRLIDQIAEEILEGVSSFLEGNMLALPQESHLFVCARK